ncbi:MAG TPA: DNA integrity scanning protein DisA nucleotide-binding domain protein [Candidatus Nanoarchaeia archaeon]|nr:DNA integrity scanning protein DisA nucleotide-binding domain protein [Candidatus Nanoarchaeia archaeon]
MVSKNKEIQKIEEILIGIAIKIARQEKGCLFVIKQNGLQYENLIPQDVKPFRIIDNQRRLEALALVDGACIIDKNGDLIAYAAQISNTKSFKGFGTRHSAAFTASLNKNIAILASEEDKKIRVFKNGKLLMQIDPMEKNIEHRTKEAVNVLESIGAGSIVTLGASVLAPTLGITLIPGIVIFGSTYYLIKMLQKKK